MTAETAEPGTTSTGNATVTGTLLPAEGRVKRNLAGCEADAATTRCRENGNGYPAGGLCACAGQRPRWVRIFSMTAAWSMTSSSTSSFVMGDV